MATVNVHEAKTQLSSLLVRTATGDEILIARAGTPVVRLVPVDGVPARKFGGLATNIPETSTLRWTRVNCGPGSKLPPRHTSCSLAAF